MVSPPKALASENTYQRKKDKDYRVRETGRQHLLTVSFYMFGSCAGGQADGGRVDRRAANYRGYLRRLNVMEVIFKLYRMEASGERPGRRLFL